MGIGYDGTGNKVNGKVVSKEEWEAMPEKEGIPYMAKTCSQTKPWRSVGMACAPWQVKEFNDALAADGITGAEHLPDGIMEITGGTHVRKKVCKHKGLFDQDAGYDDHAG